MDSEKISMKKFRFTAACESGHSQEFTWDLPERAAAEFLREFFNRGGCGVCGAAVKVELAEPLEFN